MGSKPHMIPKPAPDTTTTQFTGEKVTKELFLIHKSIQEESKGLP